MREVLSITSNIAVLVFAISSMLAVGLAHAWHEVVAPLRAIRRSVRALIGNFILVPLLALILLAAFPMEPALAIGLFLVACAAGAPFLIKLAQTAQSNLALSATLLIVLLPATMIYLPIVVPLALPVARVDPVAIAMPLVLTLLVPLALGLAAHTYLPNLSARLQPFMARLSTVALVILVTATFAANTDAVLSILRTSAIVASLILLVGALVIGYALGGRRRDLREVLALGTAQRNISAAMVVATQTVGDNTTLAMVVTISLLGFVVLFPAAALMRRGKQVQTLAHEPDRAGRHRPR